MRDKERTQAVKNKESIDRKETKGIKEAREMNKRMKKECNEKRMK